MARMTMAVLAGALLSAAALACVKPEPSPATPDENPCVAGPFGCGSYVSCPGPDVCGTASLLCGFTTCTTQGTINMKCSTYISGTYNTTTLCCQSGTLVGPSGTTAAVTVMVGSGNCGWCEPVPPGDL